MSYNPGDIVWLKSAIYSGRPDGWDCIVKVDNGETVTVKCIGDGKWYTESKSIICNSLRKFQHGDLVWLKDESVWTGLEDGWECEVLADHGATITVFCKGDGQKYKQNKLLIHSFRSKSQGAVKPKPNALLMAERSKKAEQKDEVKDDMKEDVSENVANGVKGGYEYLGKYTNQLGKMKEEEKINFHAFMSHAQADAQDVVGLIALELKTNYGLKIWLDMQAANLNVEGKLLGIAQSETFLLYATQNYMTHPFCVFELLVAIQLKKKIQILWDTDTRHCGFNQFGEFKAQVPKEFSSIFDIEAIDWQRREPKKSVQLNLLANRMKGSMPISSWSAADFLEWVISLAPTYEQYRETLKSEGIEGKDVVDGTYTVEDLQDLGISKAHSKKIMRKVNDLVPSNS